MLKLPTLEELLEAGVHFGHQVRRGHPRMRPYIYGVRDGVHIIDLTKSEEYLKIACEFLYNLGKEGKSLLFVGTKKQARPIVEEWAQELESPYLVQRWIGGFLTNFEAISKNIKRLKELKEQREKGELKKYTKKEQMLLDRQIANLEKDYKGVLTLQTLPDAIFVIDAVSDFIAIKEANGLKITVVAIADSNCNPTLIDYPIPGNDDAIKSIKILVEAVSQAFESGKKEAGKFAAKEAKRVEDEEAAKKQEEEIPEELKVEVEAVEEKVEKAAVKESEKVV
jgi:small subunit ribosomal protein S2